MSKESIKRKIKKKLISLAKKDDKLRILNSGYHEIFRLIELNKKPNFNSIKEVNSNRGVLDFREVESKRKRKRRDHESDINDVKGKIYVPFYLYKLKDRKVKISNFLIILGFLQIRKFSWKKILHCHV